MRSVFVFAHTTRQRIIDLAHEAVDQLHAAGVQVRMLPEEARACLHDEVRVVEGPAAARDCELVLALGGDGTFLRAAEYAHPAGVPLLGVNLGHVGFLAEADAAHLTESVAAVVAGRYTVEERVTVEADLVLDGMTASGAWALNEVCLERTERARVLEVAVSVDDAPLLRFGCDGLLCSTPTGSTAYAFSAGGPIVWPDVDAMIVVPIAAHATFARPIVVAPTAQIELEVLSEAHDGVLVCDGYRSIAVPTGARVRVRRGAQPVRVVRLDGARFAQRLVTKFQLPTRSLRDAPPGTG